MPAKFYRSGRELFPELFEEIRAAESEILISLYRFKVDETGQKFIKLLAESVSRGVRVKVLFDAIGSRHQEKEIFAALRGAGAEVRAFRPLPGLLLTHPLAFLCRDHARLFLFDRKRFGTGGVGFGDVYLNREDFSVLMDIENVECLVAYFDYLWNLSVKALVASRALEVQREIAPGLSAVFSGPDRDEQEMYRLALAAVSAARRRIIVMVPFFFPSRKLLSELLAAAKRGVHIEVITPLRTDKPRYDRFRALPAPLLIRRGVHWWGTKAYFHQKFFIFDDHWTFGSTNFDVISMERNYEFNLQGKGGEVLQKLEEAATEAKRENRSISSFPTSWFLRGLTGLFYRVAEFFFSLT